MSTAPTYRLIVDGAEHVVDGPPLRPLLHALRDDLGITGPKVGCEIGVCGLCAVLIDGELRSACLAPVAMAEGRTVTTVAGLTPTDGLSPLQEAFVRHGAAQCGFCTPAQITTASALLAEEPAPDEDAIRRWMAGTLCRCTGYAQIVEAVAACGAATIEAMASSGDA
jgi:aerobic-type carbon monoxide dehydrogenase small subunit (CoxS/CutS family)